MFIKWAIMKLVILYALVSTHYMIADIFTKATDLETFEKMRNVMRNIGEPTLNVELPYSLARAVSQYMGWGK